MRNSLTGGSVHALMDMMAADGTEYMARTVDSQSPSYAPARRGWPRRTGCGSPGSATPSRVSARPTASHGRKRGRPRRSRWDRPSTSAWRSALTPTPRSHRDVRQRRDLGCPHLLRHDRGESSLLNYYRMDDSSGTAIDDLETANNNGTYSGRRPSRRPGDRRQQRRALRRCRRLRQHCPADPGRLLDRIGSSPTQSYGTTCTQWWQGAGLVDAEFGGLANDFGVSFCQGKVIGGVGGGSETSV